MQRHRCAPLTARNCILLTGQRLNRARLKLDGRPTSTMSPHKNEKENRESSKRRAEREAEYSAAGYSETHLSGQSRSMTPSRELWIFKWPL
jgi:hypothetical protein